MNDLQQKLRSLISELSRRRVFRVVAMYVLAAAAVAQAADVMLPRLGLPDWTVTLVVALSALGLPLAAALAWAFDITREGVRRSDEGQPGPPRLWPIAALVLVLAVTGAWWTRAREAAPPPISEDAGDVTGTLAILPFSFRGGEPYAYLGTGMVDLLSTKLDGAGSLRTVGPRAVLGLVRQTGGDLDDAAAEQVAARLGAGLYVLGQVVEVNGRIHLSASVHRRGGGDAPVQASVEGDAENIFGLVDELAAQLLSEMAGGPGARITRVAAATTHSLPALKAYLEGEDLLRGGHFPSALESFRRAIAADSSFALAWYRLSIAAEWTGSTDAVRAAEEAYSRSGRLSEHDRRLVEALLAWRRGDALEAERLYRAIVGSWPDDVEAWFQLAEVLFHYDPWRGGGVEPSRDAFERVLFYEPDHVTSLWHVARVAASEGKLEEMDSLVRRVQALTPEGDRTLELIAMRAFRSGDSAGMAEVERALAEAIDLTRFMTVWNVSAYAGDLEGGHRVAALMAHPSRATEVRATGHLLRAHMDLGLGRVSDARRELEAAGALDPAAGVLHEAMFALHPAITPSRDSLRAARERLRTWSPERTGAAPAVIYFDPAGGARAEARAFLLGVLSARLGDAAAAEGAAAELEAAALEGEWAGLAADYARVVRAEMALAAGDTAGGLTQLERLRGEVWYSAEMQSQLTSQPYARFRRAEVLEASGRLRDALGWYDAFDEIGAYDMAYESVAAFRRGRVREALGERAAAADEYRRALELWAGADAELAPLVTAAQGGLERMGG